MSSAEIQAIVDELQSLLLVLPTETLVRINVGATLFNYFGNHQRAIEVLQAGLLIDPLEAEYYRWMGRVYIDQGSLAEARTSIMRAVELAPDNPNQYGTMAELELEADNLPASLDWMRQAIEIDSQDHELAANIARHLYRLEMPEEGDYWLSRVNTLAPSSGIARSLEVLRAATREDSVRALALASEVIADQVENRQGAYGGVVFYYVEQMLQQGRAQEAYDFLVSVRPDIAHYDEIAQNVQGLILQWASIGLLTGFSSPEERQAAWQAFSSEMTAIGIPWKQGPSDPNVTWDHLMNGKLEQAIEHYLEYELEEPLAKNLDRHKKLFYAMYGPVYEDPRVAAKLSEDAKRYAEVREEVREMLQRPEWSNP
jgi:tetratricopeptide (TPR) repeat protein